MERKIKLFGIKTQRSYIMGNPRTEKRKSWKWNWGSYQ